MKDIASNISGKTVVFILAFIWFLITVYPLFFMFVTGFKTNMEFFDSIWSFPGQLNINNYVKVFETGFHRYYLNSLLVSVLAVLIIIIAGSMASYAISRLKFCLSKAVFSLFLAGMMIPIHITLIPIYKMTQSMGLYDNLFGLIGPYVAFNLPTSIFILTGFMKDIPVEMEEAAFMDGANTFQIFTRVIFPLTKPAISTIAIYNFLMLWNEFVYALILLSSQKNWNLTMGLWNFQGEFGVNIPLIMAALFLSILPLMILYVFLQENIIKGMMAGAIKG